MRMRPAGILRDVVPRHPPRDGDVAAQSGATRSSTSNASSATRMRGRRSTLTGTSANEDLRAPLDQPRVKPIAHDDPSCLRAHKGAAERVECESH